MWLIITKISADTTHSSLRKFVNKGVRNQWFFIPSRTKGQIKRCGLLRITDPETKATECHGLVFVQPVKTALSTVDQLDGAKFNGAPVGVRRYIQRNTERDRRNLFCNPRLPEKGERRRRDRRRYNYRTEKIYQN